MDDFFVQQIVGVREEAERLTPRERKSSAEIGI